jgi:hypothetical protein
MNCGKFKNYFSKSYNDGRIERNGISCQELAT